MELSSYLIDRFAKATVNKQKTKKETTVYGTIQFQNGQPFVKIDGSNILTPVTTTADIETGNRVIVQIKDHSAVVTGNISSPSASSTTVSEIVIDQEKINRIDRENQQIKETLTNQTDQISELTGKVTTLEKKVAALENNS